MSGQRGRFCCLVLAGVLAAVLPARTCADGPTPLELRQKTIDVRLALIRLKAEESVLELEKSLLAGLEPGDPVENLPAAVKERLARIFPRSNLLKDSRQRLKQAVDELSIQVGREEKLTEAGWRKAMEFTLDGKQQWTEGQVRLDCTPGQTPPLLPVGPARARLFLWTSVALAMGLLLAVFETRRERRPRWQTMSLLARASLWLALLAILAGLGWWAWLQAGELRAADQPILWPLNEGRAAVLYRQELQTDLDRAEEAEQRLRAKNRKAQIQIEQKRAELDDAWARRLGFPGGQAFRAFVGDFHKRLHPLLVTARTAELLGSDAVERVNRSDQSRQLAAALDGVGDRLWRRAVVRTTLCVLAVVASLSPWLVVRARIARRRRTARRVCPCCDGALRKGTGSGGQHLRGCETTPPPNPLPEAERGRRKVEVSARGWVASFFLPLSASGRGPGGGVNSPTLSCQACQYGFPGVYRGLRRLCFSTVGVPESGKTLWLLEVYHLLTRRNIPVEAAFDLVSSIVNQDFDAQLEALHRSSCEPGNTKYQEDHLPHPLLVHFRDRDRDKPGALLHLFDVGGEMTAGTIDLSRPRRRVLGMDGLIFVLDPTWPFHPDQPTIDRQRLALEGCLAEIRQVRGVPAGRDIPVPVAVCLTKLDLIPTQSLYETASLDWLDRIRGTDSSRASLDMLKKRSSLVKEALPALFPGWNISQAFESHFGANVLFFPLTPVGLDDNDTLLSLRPGAESLRDRAMTSFGVVEPILWLLHVHGYRVFEESMPPVTIEYPRIVEYGEALEHPHKCFRAADLQGSLPETDARGHPMPRTGGVAAVFKLNVGNVNVALKVFKSFNDQREQRYRAVSEYLHPVQSRYLIDFAYTQDGIRVPRSGETYRDAQWYPVLRMEWVAGLSLKDWIEERVGQRDVRALERLADRWSDLVGQLKRLRIAHGDLQHGNVMVVDNDLVLIDYDGMCVPALQGQEAAESGLPGYQHPLRGQQPLTPELDDFSAWIVWIALRAVAVDPGLWQRHVVAVENDNLLFTARDIHDPDRSTLWRDLLALKDAEVVRRVRDLRDSLDQPFDRVPAFNALPEEERRIQQVLDLLYDQSKADRAYVDLSCVPLHPERFHEHRESLQAHMQREMDRVVLRPQGEPELIGEGPARMVVVRWTGWTWRTLGLGEQTCKVAVSAEGFFDAPAEGRCSQVRHRAYSADRGVKRAVPPGAGRLFVSVWPVLRLEALDIEAVGQPLHLPIALPALAEEGRLRKWLKRMFTD